MVAGNQNKTATETLKFLCSYGGKILLRHTDGQLRYVGGHTRVLSVDPSISFSGLFNSTPLLGFDWKFDSILDYCFGISLLILCFMLQN